jgi:hypothetical protein
MTEQPSPYRFFFFSNIDDWETRRFKTNKQNNNSNSIDENIFFFCLSPTHPHDNRLFLYISIKTGLMCVMCVSVCAYIIPHYILNFSFWMFQWSSRVKYYTQRGVCVWEALQINFFFCFFFWLPYRKIPFFFLVYYIRWIITSPVSLSLSLNIYIKKATNCTTDFFIYIFLREKESEGEFHCKVPLLILFSFFPFKFRWPLYIYIYIFLFLLSLIYYTV